MNDPRVFVYRHEDLTRDPEPVVRAVCAHLGLAYAPEMLQYHTKPRMWFGQSDLRKGDGTTTPEHQALRNWQVNQPIFDSSGRWKTDLAPDLVPRFDEGALGAMMRRFGYL